MVVRTIPNKVPIGRIEKSLVDKSKQYKELTGVKTVELVETLLADFFKNKIWVKLALSTMEITELSYNTAESVSVASTSARYFIRKIDDNRLAYIASNSMYIIDLSELTCKRVLSQYFNPICDYDDNSILCWYANTSEDYQAYNSISILKYK